MEIWHALQIQKSYILAYVFVWVHLQDQHQHYNVVGKIKPQTHSLPVV